MEDVFDIRLSHCIHIPSGDKHELRVTKKPAGAEQLLFSRRLLCAEAEMTPSPGVRSVMIRSDSLYRVSFRTRPGVTMVSICFFSCRGGEPLLSELPPVVQITQNITGAGKRLPAEFHIHRTTLPSLRYSVTSMVLRYPREICPVMRLSGWAAA